jgi:hypothetical protein
MKPLIAFAGPKGIGKSTAAQYLVTKYGYERRSFADPLRNMLRVLGLTDEDFGRFKEVPNANLAGKTPRQAMQLLGTEWGRNMIGVDLWAEAAVRDLPEGVVFDDCRFENEAVAVRSRGGYVVEIMRPGFDYRHDHASENGLPNRVIDARIVASSVSKLHQELDWLVRPETPEIISGLSAK